MLLDVTVAERVYMEGKTQRMAWRFGRSPKRPQQVGAFSAARVAVCFAYGLKIGHHADSILAVMVSPRAFKAAQAPLTRPTF